MLKTDYEQRVDEIMTNHFSDYNPFDDIEFIVSQEKWCIIRTYRLLPTLLFMQKSGWKLWEMLADDEDGIEYEILTFYKPKKVF